MKRFNLSKFYTLNWLLWGILAGNIISIGTIVTRIIIFNKTFLWTLGLYDLCFIIEVTYLFYFLFVFIILFTTIVEIILRKAKKITTYNELIMPKKLRITLISLAITLFVLDFIIFRVSFYFVDLFLNGP